MTESVGVGMTSRPAARHGIRDKNVLGRNYSVCSTYRTPFRRGGKREKDHMLTIARDFSRSIDKGNVVYRDFEKYFVSPPCEIIEGNNIRG